ncbi:MAG: sigma-70 family RNA polymerase sigma factor [Blautia sp.]|nr:sigma-70 family RNA polymerase sigma factor [Blautia sp.]
MEMEDAKIIELFLARAEAAISETAMKYGKLCYRIANNILANHEDSEECVNDTYLALWNNIPPKRPSYFPAFTGKITRNFALKKYEYCTAKKRNQEAVCSLEELGECVSGTESVETELENKRIEELINDFLWKQDQEKRDVFILRYWYFESLESICRRTGFSQGKIKSMLFQLRGKLRTYLESEGVTL